MKVTRKVIRIRKDASWRKKEIARLDRLINRVRAARFGYRLGGAK